MDLIRQLVRHVGNDWMLNVHESGHNPTSWAIAAVCGVAAQFGPGATLMLHSGMAPGYIRNAPKKMRHVIRLACALYRQIICVNDEIASAVADSSKAAILQQVTNGVHMRMAVLFRLLVGTAEAVA